MKIVRSTLLAVLAMLSSLLYAQKKEPVLRLRNGAFRIEKNLRTSYIDSFNRSVLRFKGKAFAVLQFETIPSFEKRKILSAAGIDLQEYLPDNAYTATLSGDVNFGVLNRAGVVSLVNLKPEQKMEAHLSRGEVPSWAVKVPGTVDVQISFPKTFTAADVIAQLRQLNIDIISFDRLQYRLLTLRLASARLKELASQPFIQFLQPAIPAAQPLNDKSRSGSGANFLNATSSNGGKGLNGEGITVGIGDNADIFNHIDFTGRLIDRSYQPTNALHGYHTAGTLAGAGNLEELYRGYAPRATIVSQSYDGIIADAANYVNDYGMALTSNSYGNVISCSYDGTYDLYSQYVDQMAFDLPYLENIFAAGNSGGSTCSPFQPGFHTVLGGYQSSKNLLIVGATSDMGTIASFSSRGPVIDGRIKPEVMAVGQNVISTGPGNFYFSTNGTSMATPGVSGGVALLYQRYKQLNGNAFPKNALIKALICNGATDKGNTGPDFSYGFGWMNLLRSLDMMENNHYFSGNSVNGSSDTYTINVPANTAQLKVLLYWNDPAASPLSSQALVNDLDLQVTDPSSSTFLPKVLDTNNANLNIPATTGVDHTNNIEQVVIDNPVAGTYTVNVKGTAITQNPSQEYWVSYDPVPVQLKLTSPAGGEGWAPGYDQMRIKWEAYGYASGTVKLEYSTDNGASWNAIATGVDINSDVYIWSIPNTPTDKALIRITKEGSGETDTSYPFVIAGKPVITLNSIQCEGYIGITWNAITGASDYEVMRLNGTEMTSVAITTDTTYTFSGLSKDSVYWVTVRPRINGAPGRRAYAVSRQPNTGTCTGTISDNDLKLDALLAPVTGRKFTSSALGISSVTVRVKNLDDAPVTGFDVSYSINGGPWQTESDPSTIAAGGTINHSFTTTEDFSAAGTYIITAVVKNNTADPVSANDTLVVTVKQLDNQPIDLSSTFTDDVEAAAVGTYQAATMGLNGLDRYDYTNSTANGRMRTFINSGLAYSGTKALTLDASSASAGTTNFLTGTFNLNTYDVNVNDIRLDLQYNSHSQPAAVADSIWVRGSETQAWIPAYSLDANQAPAGTYKKTSSIEVSHLLSAAGQAFSPSFQLRLGQYGFYPATDRNVANGYTFDDIRLYQVFNDCQMLSINSPVASSCALSNATPINVTVRNSDNTALTNIPVRYQIDGGTWVTETISSIAGNTNLSYTFSAAADLSAFGIHTIRTLVDYPSDSYHDNDTAIATIRNTPLVTSFPYLENFESGNGNWLVSGTNASWEYGTPASTKINGAASGVKAWKTRLAGNYNDDELSYLSGPCFDVSSLTNPTLSFSMALDLEDCGSTLCDGAWVEYSTDGVTWNKLGANGAGTNWYNKSGSNVWSVQNYTRWHVATMPLPTGAHSLRLRFVMQSDPATNYEGIALDDVHVYDDTAGIYNGATLAAPVSLKVSGNNWFDFEAGGQKIVSIQSNNLNLDTTRAQAFINTGPVRYDAHSSQYYLDRNITVKPVNRTLSDSVTVRFYFLDSEAEALFSSTVCPGCTKPASAYKFGISKYSDPDTTYENGTIGDNYGGTWKFIPSNKLTVIPFDKGYYAEFKVRDFSEFWLNNGGLDNATTLPVKLVRFSAEKNNADVSLSWDVSNELNIKGYEVQEASGNDALQANQFRTLGVVAASASHGLLQTYQFEDGEPGKKGARYYRLKVLETDGSYTYSPLRSVVFDGLTTPWQVFPNPSDGNFKLSYQLSAGEVLNVKLFDSKGSLMKEYHSIANGFLQKLIIDITGHAYAPGVYLLKAEAGSGTQSFKLFKR